MTRETKIGLLVGLAFIIVIGILLSDQLMRSTEPPPANLGVVADNVRKATITPASSNPVVRQVEAPQNIVPENPVPMREEIVRRPPPVTFVEIRPGGGSTVVEQPGAVVQNNNVPIGTNVPPTHNVLPLDNTTPPVRTNTPDHTGVRSIAEVAAAMGETLLGPDGQPLRAAPGTRVDHNGIPTGPIGTPVTSGQRPVATATNGMKPYKVEPGDNLSRIARKAMGADTKANRDAIIKANPALAADPNKVIIGQTYNIPVVAANPPVVTPVATERTAVAPRPTTPAVTENIYTVQPGDTLTRIARDQVGDPTAMAAIKELNRDQVKNWDVLQVGTRLRLPNKPPAASASAR